MSNLNISSKYLLIVALIAVLAVAGVGAVSADSHDGNTYTGCLNRGGNINNVAIGSSPTHPCGPNETQITLVDKAFVEALAGDLQTQITALQADLAAETAAREAADTALQADVQANTDKLVHFSIQGGTEIYITGANLHLVNGEGSTATTNGLGNVIIGYNEESPTSVDRTGSHMLVVGSQHNYSSYGGIVVGVSNTTSGPYASVSGGYFNRATGDFSSVSAGLTNTASGSYSSVSGGANNTALAYGTSVSGGDLNTTSGPYASISGGRLNVARGAWSSVSGGYNRLVAGEYDWRAGGLFEDN